MSRKGAFGVILGLSLFAMMGVQPAAAAPLTIGYSDWPGWVAWQVAIDKGWFKEAGVDVTFQWFDYSASMDAFAAGKIDANLMTNGDTLVTGAGGGKGIMIMLTDYSSGNDIIVGEPNQPVRAQRRLRQSHQGVGSRRTLHRRPENPTGRGQDHGQARWSDAGRVLATAQGHPPARRGGRQEDVQERRRPRFALRLDEERRRLQRRQRGLQGGAEDRQLHRSVADRGCQITAARGE